MSTVCRARRPVREGKVPPTRLKWRLRKRSDDGSCGSDPLRKFTRASSISSLVAIARLLGRVPDRLP
jgi:hypothetical protein